MQDAKETAGQAKVVKGLQTLEMSRGTVNHRRRPFLDVDLVDRSKPMDEDDLADLPNMSPWLFVIALEATLRTLCKAGSYVVKDIGNEDKLVISAGRELIEEHLANARKRPDDHIILKQVSRIDLTIRRKWWRFCRDDSAGSRTFTSCMREHVANADQQ